MIKFLIQRPIAVLMAFTACFIIGLVTYSTLPISLLPNIAIPEITVQVASALLCPGIGKHDCQTFAGAADSGLYPEGYS